MSEQFPAISRLLQLEDATGLLFRGLHEHYRVALAGGRFDKWCACARAMIDLLEAEAASLAPAPLTPSPPSHAAQARITEGD